MKLAADVHKALHGPPVSMRCLVLFLITNDKAVVLLLQMLEQLNSCSEACLLTHENEQQFLALFIFINPLWFYINHQ